MTLFVTATKYFVIEIPKKFGAISQFGHIPFSHYVEYSGPLL